MQVLLADSANYVGFLPEQLSPLLVSAQNQFKFTHIIAVNATIVLFKDMVEEFLILCSEL